MSKKINLRNCSEYSDVDAIDLISEILNELGVEHSRAQTDKSTEHIVYMPGIDPPVEAGSILMKDDKCLGIIENLTKVRGQSLRVHCKNGNKIRGIVDRTDRIIIETVENGGIRVFGDAHGQSELIEFEFDNLKYSKSAEELMNELGLTTYKGNHPTRIEVDCKQIGKCKFHIW